MADIVANIYLLARKYSGIKRIDAAQELAIAESTLKNYELGIAPVQDITVLKMSRLYGPPWLRVQHLEKNPLFCDVFGIMIDQDNLAIGVLQVQKEVNDVVSNMDGIVEDVVSDGKLSNMWLIDEMKGAAVALLNIFGRFSGRKKKPPALARKRFRGCFDRLSCQLTNLIIPSLIFLASIGGGQ